MSHDYKRCRRRRSSRVSRGMPGWSSYLASVGGKGKRVRCAAAAASGELHRPNNFRLHARKEGRGGGRRVQSEMTSTEGYPQWQATALYTTPSCTISHHSLTKQGEEGLKSELNMDVILVRPLRLHKQPCLLSPISPFREGSGLAGIIAKY